MDGSDGRSHHAAEERMRELLRDGGLPEPDEVRYEFDPNEVVFMWHERRLAVVIDLDDDAPSSGATAIGSAGSADDGSFASGLGAEQS